MKLICKALSLVAMISVVGAVPLQASAQADYPNKPVRLVVGFSPGGLSDVMARAIAVQLSQSMGQQVTVENRTGAGSTIAGDHIARSAPDGYTIWLQDMTNHAINATLFKKLPYDSIRDFTPVSNIAISPLLLVTHPSQPVKTVQELVAMIKAQPKKHAYASAGAGTGNHLAAELLRGAASLDVVHVPYKGSAPSVVAMLANETLFSFVTLPASLSHVTAGKLRALAVTTPSRVGAAPDVPTMIESGLNVEIASISGIMLPARAPAAIVNRLNAEFAKAIATAEVKDVFAKIGAEALGSTPQQMATQLAGDIAKFAPLVRASGASAD